jgi:opacity protein-like surface antigen
MKKIILAIAALALIAAPAMAVDWNFYGSARIQTSYHWWDSKDATENTFNTSAFTTQVGDDAPNFDQDDDDDGLYWDLLGTSRIGARVRGEGVNARFEFNNGVGTRLLWGRWRLSPGFAIQVGQDWRPLNYFYSGQQINDAGMAGPEGAGGIISHRDPQLKLLIGEGQNLHIAFVDPDRAADIGDSDYDQYMPIIEANYHFAADTFFFDVGGAFVSYDVEGTGDDADNPDDSVEAWIVALGGGVNFGPLYFNGNVGYGLNVADLGMVTNETFTRNAAKANDDGDWDDNDTMLALLVGGFRFTDQMAIEAGVGYEYNEDDFNEAKDDETLAVYAHFNWSPAPGVSVIPEIGYVDLMDNGLGNEEGDLTYISVKWQVDF